MEIGDFNGSAVGQAEEALTRMMTSASSVELKQAFDDYLAILDRSGLADLSTDEPYNLKKGGLTLARGGAD
jgi:hypothetical protein